MEQLEFKYFKLKGEQILQLKQLDALNSQLRLYQQASNTNAVNVKLKPHETYQAKFDAEIKYKLLETNCLSLINLI